MKHLERNTQIDLVTAAGGTFTDRYHELVRRQAEADTDNISPTQRYTQAVIDGEPMDQVLLWGSIAAANAGPNPAGKATVRNALQAALNPLLEAEIAVTATKNYELIRSKFNKTGKAFR